MKISKLFRPVLFLAGLLTIAIFAGCWKKGGEAIVLEKEHIAAGETPTPGPSASPIEPSVVPVNPDARPHASAHSEESASKPLAEDEIVVESYVMKKDVRGTSKDPRACPGLEQWRITVRLTGGGGGFLVLAKQAQYERLKVGDRVKVRYSQGKYTGTVWNAEIVD
jgi:hypothetical protein